MSFMFPQYISLVTATNLPAYVSKKSYVQPRINNIYYFFIWKSWDISINKMTEYQKGGLVLVFILCFIADSLV